MDAIVSGLDVGRGEDWSPSIFKSWEEGEESHLTCYPLQEGFPDPSS